jgi:hypothetical protein
MFGGSVLEMRCVCRGLMFAGWAVVALSVSGCAYFKTAMTEQRLEHGYVIVLPGIEGPSAFNSNVAQGLIDADTKMGVEVLDWTTGLSPAFLVHLQNQKRNREQARDLAERIILYQDEYPGRPVYLVGHSGGAGMALMTLEALPEDRQIEGVVLLAGAISRDYDLRYALSKTSRGIWNYHSPGDWFYLVAGTSLFGTIDRVHAPSAGAYGFRVPEILSEAERQLYAKLHQVPYQFRMMAYGNYGGHFGPVMRSFSRNELSKLIE